MIIFMIDLLGRNVNNIEKQQVESMNSRIFGHFCMKYY